jgi:hypothetical protein
MAGALSMSDWKIQILEHWVVATISDHGGYDGKQEAFLIDKVDGSGTNTEEALQARKAGRLARDAGKSLNACPYPADTQANYQWASGWMQPQATAPEDAS